jgi:hypothetical protein
MSNFLAIATVTATLRRVLQASLDVDVPGAAVGTVRPDGDGGSAPPMGVNIYLFQVTPNAAWRNADLPTRDSAGNVRKRPTAALELHYLLTFHGDDGQLEPQRVMGSVVRSLHESPQLTRDMIQDTLLAPTFNYLATSNLADQVERVKFTPTALSLEEFSKLWSVFFQIPYTLSIAYQGSVVLIDGEESPRTVLPVQRRNLLVLPFQQPFIEDVSPDAPVVPVANNAPEPPRFVEAGGTLRITGQNFRGEILRVNFGVAEVSPATISNTVITVVVPPGLTSGVRALQVIKRVDFGSGSTSEPHRAFESNVAPFVLAPKIILPQPSPAGPALGTVQRGAAITINVVPPVGRDQDVRLLVGDSSIVLPPRPPTDPPLAASLTFDVPANFPTGEFIVRLQVDGAQSNLTLDPAAGFTGPRLTISAGAQSLRSSKISLASTASGMTATVTVVDESAATVLGAMITAAWALPDSTTQNDSQVTDNDGVATFTIPGGNGQYVLTIVNITKDGYAFDKAGSGMLTANSTRAN